MRAHAFRARSPQCTNTSAPVPSPGLVILGTQNLDCSLQEVPWLGAGALSNNWSKEAMTMLMRTDPFRELDRLTQQVFGGQQGTWSRSATMPMDVYRTSR